MKKRHGALRADTLRVLANPGKEREVLRLLPTTAGSRSSSDACSGAGSDGVVPGARADRFVAQQPRQ
jgi:hypothetical protein